MRAAIHSVIITALMFTAVGGLADTVTNWETIGHGTIEVIK